MAASNYEIVSKRTRRTVKVTWERNADAHPTWTMMMDLAGRQTGDAPRFYMCVSPAETKERVGPGRHPAESIIKTPVRRGPD